MKADAMFLVHMLERVRRIQRNLEVDRDAFFASEPLKDMAARNFEIIG